MARVRRRLRRLAAAARAGTKSIRDQAAKAERAAATPPKAAAASAAAPAAAAKPSVKPRKLSYKEQRELDELPARIEALEAEQAKLVRLLSDADAYTRDRRAWPPRRRARP